LAFTTGAGQPPRIRSIPALGTSLLLSEIDKARLRFALPDETPVLLCYEPGRGTSVPSTFAFGSSAAIRQHAVHRLSRGMPRLKNSRNRSLVRLPCLSVDMRQHTRQLM
jgi:hypothetical protein